MTTRQTLEALGRAPDDAIDLFEGALALSVWAEPGLAPGPYRRHGRTLQDDVAAYVNADEPLAPLVAEAARQVLHRRYGYADLQDPLERGDGALLARVIDRRRGGAWALCLVYIHALKTVDVLADVVTFQPRPLVRLQDRRGQRLILDPLDGGRVLSASDMRAIAHAHRANGGELNPFDLSNATHRAILIALQDELKTHHLRNAAPEAALAALQGALLVAPNEARLWRETALLNARLDNIEVAIFALEKFLDLPGGDAHRYSASQMLQQLQARLNRNPS